jgi:hypothetical protein
VISPRDEIWIDMMQFDVRAADRLWERTAPVQGAPGWYDDVSGLIETASGPAEPHELVDEPVVVEDMRRTTLGRRPRHCAHRRTVGRVIAMKAAAATTASVFGVAAAAAATTGIVATLASVVVPVIEEHVLRVQDEREPTTPVAPPPGPVVRGPDPSLDNELLALAAAPPLGPTPTVSTPPAVAEPAAARVTPTPAAAAVEPVVVTAPPNGPAPLEPVANEPVATDPSTVTPQRPPATRPAPPTGPAAVEPAPGKASPDGPSPPAEAPPDKVVPPRDTAVSPDTSHRGSGSGRSHRGRQEAADNDAPGEAAVKSAERPRPARSRRPG